MPKPSGHDVDDFSYRRIWDALIIGNPAPHVNTRDEFINYLKGKGCPGILAEEFAEKNIPLLITKLQAQCEHWEALGVPRPVHIVNQQGGLITWTHPKFETISGYKQLPHTFCDVWNWVKNSKNREFLFCCAAYLLLLGCDRIFITDTTGDAGLDLMGFCERHPLRGLCFVVQAKTADNEVAKDSLFSDYTKYILLRHQPKWPEYQKAVGIDKTQDGVGIVYIFASNLEFQRPIIEAARDLPIMLRSGRQIAHALSCHAALSKWTDLRVATNDLSASLTRNLFPTLSKVL